MGGIKAQRLCWVCPKAGAVTVIMLLRFYFHWKSWDHSITLTLALDFFKWYWFRKSGFGFDSLAEVKGWLNMSSSVRLFSCPDQSCWLLWPSQDVFSRLSCGLRIFFCRVNKKPGTNQSLQTLVKDFHSLFFFFLFVHCIFFSWSVRWLDYWPVAQSVSFFKWLSFFPSFWSPSVTTTVKENIQCAVKND